MNYDDVCIFSVVSFGLVLYELNLNLFSVVWCNCLLHFRSSDFVCEGFKFNGHLVRTVCLFVPFQL